MVDLKNITNEQRTGLASLVGAMQKTAIEDLQHLKNIGAQIWTFATDEKTGKTNAVLNFDQLDDETLGVLSYSIEMLQESLLKNFAEENVDPDEKGIFMSTPQGEMNMSSNEMKKEVSDLTPIGIFLLEMHWNNINKPFTSDSHRVNKSSFFANVVMFFKRIFK
jgi:hypothetical protein